MKKTLIGYSVKIAVHVGGSSMPRIFDLLTNRSAQDVTREFSERGVTVYLRRALARYIPETDGVLTEYHKLSCTDAKCSGCVGWETLEEEPS